MSESNYPYYGKFDQGITPSGQKFFALCGLVKFTESLKKLLKRVTAELGWLVNANRFASNRYRYTVLFTVTFLGKYSNVYQPSWLSPF